MCQTHRSHDDEDLVSPPKWPEERNKEHSWFRQCYDRWTYSYMDIILEKGSRQFLEGGKNLTHDDLFSVPVAMQSKGLRKQFRAEYSNLRSSKARVMKTLWRLAAPTFVPAGFCQLLTVFCQVGIPLLVKELLEKVESRPSEKVVKDAIPFALSIFFLSVLNAFGNHRHRHLAMKSGVVLRAAAVSTMYDHLLRLTPKGRLGLSSGEITNLIAVDTQKLFEVTQEAHLAWSLPLSIVLVTIFLVITMGPATLMGVAILVVFVPVVERLTSSMMTIRSSRVALTDRRIEITSSMLQGIKITKLNNYERNYLTRVGQVRDAELALLRKELALWAMTLVITVTSPVIAAWGVFSTYVLTSENNVLTASKTFSVLLLLAALRFPINYAGRLMGKAGQALSAVQRISLFLEREIQREYAGASEGFLGESGDVLLKLSNAAFGVSSSFEKSNNRFDASSHYFQVKSFDFEVKKGEILAICGPVGSGKSTLINGIIHEVPALENSTVAFQGSLAFVPQTPFIMNTSLRENITFGLPYNEQLFNQVIDLCSLRPDIKQLGDAEDLTEIGERGVTLSGGQKQRVSLARAAYTQPDILLLDDPFSALDAGTSRLVFDRLFTRTRDSLFSKTAIILVTNAFHFLNHVDRVMVMVSGTTRFLGPFRDLDDFQPEDEEAKMIVESMKLAIQENSDIDRSTNKDSPLAADKKLDEEKKGSLMTVEEREYGLSSWNIWLLWFRRAGGLHFLFFQILFMTIDRIAYVSVEYWLARWTEGANKPVEIFNRTFPAQSDGRSAQYKYLVVYSCLILISILGTISRSEWAVTGGARAARRLFMVMLRSVLHAPMFYFETTPMGRIINRFTHDIETIDVRLTEAMSMFLISLSWYVAGVTIICFILPYMLAVILPISGMYWFLLMQYRRSGADLQRLDAISRSPIQAMISEGIDGSATIRVFGQRKTFLERFFSEVDRNSSAMLNFVSGQRWLGLRIEILGSIVVLVSSILVISLNDDLKIEPGLVGLLILWSGNFTITLGFVVDNFAEVEASITAIERVDAMAYLPQEKSMETSPDVNLPATWPGYGKIEFKDVCLRYRTGLPLSLNRLSFTIPAGHRCGVVGRTGAGKSSVTVALFRIVEIEAGRILLDDVDLGQLGLSDVRGRPHGMTIIPQDPFLTGSTLRECLDPFGEKSDADLFDALYSVRLVAKEDSTEVLNTVVEEGGSNYSVGERQLLNLAAALLYRPKVLVLDEATASIDPETDAFVQKLLRSRFAGSTIITIAHRLNTIMDYDSVLVMDSGHAAEFGSPADLLMTNGPFSALVDATGQEGRKALRAMVGAP